MATRHRVVFALLLLLLAGMFLVDAVVYPGTTLPAVYYAVPVVIAAVLLPPRMVAGVAVSAAVLQLTANWLQQPPLWLAAMYLLSIVIFGSLSTALSARSAREAALTAQARADRARADESAAEAARERDRARASEELLRAIVDSSPAFIYLKDLDGRYLMVNRLFEISFHKRMADVLGKTDFEVHPTEEQARALRENDRRVVESEVPVEFEEVAQLDDSPHHFISVKFPVRDARGVVYATGGVSLDITERKRAEADLERSLAREQAAHDEAEKSAAQMKALLANLGEAVLIIDAAGRIVLRNRAAEEISGLSDEQMQNNLDGGQLTYLPLDGKPTSFEETPVGRALRGEMFTDLEGLIVRPDGSRRRVVMSGAVVRDESGRVELGLVVYRDVTELRALERMKEDYVSLISHDLRNPLTVIMGQTDWLRRLLMNKDLASEARIAENALKSARRMNAMIQDLVESARLESGRLETHPRPTNLPRLVSDIAERVGTPEDRARIRVETTVQLPPISVDPDRIERAIVNLITNALKYSPPDRPVIVRVGRTDGEAVVSVNDQGAGIPPEDIRYLFERFYQAKAGRTTGGGLGLGLYITRLIVEAHGGRVWAESEVGQGSTFSIALPLA